MPPPPHGEGAAPATALPNPGQQPLPRRLRLLPAGLLFCRNTTKSRAPKTVFASPVHPTVQDPEEPSRASLRLGRLPSRLLLPRAGPQAEAEGGSKLPSGALCALGWIPRIARDCLSGSPPASPCAGDAAHSGSHESFSLPAALYLSSLILHVNSK